MEWNERQVQINIPTLEEASVKLFKVVDFPLDGYRQSAERKWSVKE